MVKVEENDETGSLANEAVSASIEQLLTEFSGNVKNENETSTTQEPRIDSGKWVFHEAENYFRRLPRMIEPLYQLSAQKLDLLEAVVSLRPIEHLVTRDFLLAVRSSHPALQMSDDVRFCPRRKAWAVVPWANQTNIPLFIAGFGVHLSPKESSFYNPSPLVPGGHEDLDFDIGFERLPSDEDLEEFRNAFPGSVGVRVMLAGYIDVLYGSLSSAERASRRLARAKASISIGRKTLKGDISQFYFRFTCKQEEAMKPTIVPHASLSALTAAECGLLPGGCVGARIRLDGKEYFTTVTHGLVKSIDKAMGPLTLWQRLKLNFGNTKDLLRSSLIKGKKLIGSVVYSTQTPEHSKHPNHAIGTITKCYDNHSKTWMNWPEDFPHDLTLIETTGTRASMNILPIGLPPIERHFMSPEEYWADPSEYICYLGQFNVLDGSESSYFLYSGMGVHKEKQHAIVTGFMSKWPVQGAIFKRSFLWRTQQVQGDCVTRSGDAISVSGASGSLICVGKIDSTEAVRPLVFQNWQSNLLGCQADLGEEFMKGLDEPTGLVQAGFFLPAEVTRSELLWTPFCDVAAKSDPGPLCLERLSCTSSDSLPSRKKPAIF